MSRPVRRLILVDDVYDAIKSMIMDNEVAPDDRVNIDALSRELQVSPTPVREALARLEADGLVLKRPMLGYTTKPLLTLDEFEELFEIRLLLECRAAALAAQRATPAEATRLTEDAKTPSVAGVADRYGDYARFAAQDARFHDLVASIGDNEMLRAAIHRLHAHMHLYRLGFPAASAEATGVEHAAIVDAIASADPAAADHAMRVHLGHARERFLPVFDRR